ncbi:hypothetical protein [Streptomyces lasiicapitis]|uniref:Uncharacterized protein n=1 Tax=Streptomyces lasiicapitis TaxID=1923961 RepID=A0ABQ2MJX4_9ACTN|nr:hypothetical protein [Streptomyces lasiicapitis]GGO53122.1 hypothetical protein GCM10012286_59750 [Streptomyces lasiicapitis]
MEEQEPDDKERHDMALPLTRKLALATASALTLLTAGLAWQASAADSDGTDRTSSPGAKPDTVSSKEVAHDASSAAEYWTPERMREAAPAPMPVLPDDTDSANSGR